MEIENQLCVGIDLTAVWRRPTGIFRYATELAHALLQLRDQSTHYVLFFAHEIHPDFLPLRDSFTAVIAPTTNELLLKQCWFPLTLLRLKDRKSTRLNSSHA